MSQQTLQPSIQAAFEHEWQLCHIKRHFCLFHLNRWLLTVTLPKHKKRLTMRIKELAERYERTMPKQSEKVTELENAVNKHLEKMGFKMDYKNL